MKRIALTFPLFALLAGCMSIIPALVPRVDHEPDISAEFPFESKFVDVLDSRMHYVEAGDPAGPPMLLVHGNPTSSYLWRNVIPHLEGGGRVIAVDLIGMGKSGKPDIDYRLADHARYLDAFVAALELRDLTLVLHDWGGGIGFDHAMRHPDNIRGIAFMEALVMPFEWDKLAGPEAHLFRVMRSEDGDALLMDENYFVEKLVPAFAGRKLSEVEMAHYRAPFQERAARKPVRVFPQEVPFDDGQPADNFARLSATYEKLKASEIPLLLLVAEPGAIIKPAHVEKLKADLPRLQVQGIGPGMHFVQETQPTAIGKAVAAWAAELPAWRGAPSEEPVPEETAPEAAE